MNNLKLTSLLCILTIVVSCMLYPKVDVTAPEDQDVFPVNQQGFGHDMAPTMNSKNMMAPPGQPDFGKGMGQIPADEMMIPGDQPVFGRGDKALTMDDLKAMDEVVKAETAKMSPEELKAFNAAVEQLSEELSRMSPEEMDAFIDQVFFGEQAQEPQEEQTQTSLPEPEPLEQEPVIQKPKQDHRDIIQKIDALINHTTNFLHKVGIILEFPGKLKKWAEQGKIKGWQPNYQWDSTQKNTIGIKDKIEQLVHKLSLLKTQNVKTGEYTYLTHLNEYETLKKNIETLYSNVVPLVPTFDVEEFGSEPVSPESRDIIRQILGFYLDGIFTLGIPADIDALLAQYEPTAKKIAEEEGELAKKALEESKKGVKPGTTSVAGSLDSGTGGYYGTSSGGYDYGSPYSGYSGSDYSPYSSYSPSSNYGSGDYSPSSGGYNQGGTDSPSGRSRGESGKSSETSAPEGSKGSSYAAAPKSAPKENSAIMKKIRKMEAQLEGAVSEIENRDLGDHFIQIQKHVQGNDPINIELATRGIPQAIKKIETATGILKVLRTDIAPLSQVDRNNYKDHIKDAYTDYAKIADSVTSQIKEIKKAEDSVSQTKKYAYLGGPVPVAPVDKSGTASKEIEELTKTITHPISLYDLQKAIEELEKVYKGIVTTTEPKTGAVKSPVPQESSPVSSAAAA